MGIFGALTTAVTGMRAQSYALENISGNIANSQTTGFKRIDTNFADLIPDAATNQQYAGSVLASSRSTNTVQGDIQPSSVPTFMAINGDGFFTVQNPSNTVDGNPVFDSANMYTRRGDFQLNNDGYLVNGSGYFLMGVPIDQSTGNLVGSAPQVLQFKNDFLPALPTTEIQYRANLPAYPLTQKADKTVPQSELLDATGFAADPLAAGTGTVLGADATSFIQQSISGGAVTAYDSQGLPVQLQLRWAKTDAATYGGTDKWELFYQANSNAGAADVAWQNVGTTYTFANGQLSPPVSNVTLNNVSVNGNVLGNVNLLHGAGGMTEFSDANGSVQVNMIQQNGYAAGSLQSISVTDNGRLSGTYSNGRSIELAAVSLARFNGTDGLKRIDGGAFMATQASGPPLYGAGAGKLIGSSLESSNTDIADEFTKLIVTQQAYSANTRIISTSNEMTQDLLNMLR